jgi:hypothetical protein
MDDVVAPCPEADIGQSKAQKRRTIGIVAQRFIGDDLRCRKVRARGTSRRHWLDLRRVESDGSMPDSRDTRRSTRATAPARFAGVPGRRKHRRSCSHNVSAPAPWINEDRRHKYLVIWTLSVLHTVVGGFQIAAFSPVLRRRPPVAPVAAPADDRRDGFSPGLQPILAQQKTGGLPGGRPPAVSLYCTGRAGAALKRARCVRTSAARRGAAARANCRCCR